MKIHGLQIHRIKKRKSLFEQPNIILVDPRDVIYNHLITNHDKDTCKTKSSNVPILLALMVITKFKANQFKVQSFLVYILAQIPAQINITKKT